MHDDPIKRLQPFLLPQKTIGIIGLGTFGSKIQKLAQQHDMHILLCDPPRSMEDADQLNETFQQLWGNGMGGCQLSNEGLETFLPLHLLAKADVITIQVPLTDEEPYKTRGLITKAFMDRCREDIALLCFSNPEVIDENCRKDPRIQFIAQLSEAPSNARYDSEDTWER